MQNYVGAQHLVQVLPITMAATDTALEEYKKIGPPHYGDLTWTHLTFDCLRASM